METLRVKIRGIPILSAKKCLFVLILIPFLIVGMNIHLFAQEKTIDKEKKKDIENLLAQIEMDKNLLLIVDQTLNAMLLNQINYLKNMYPNVPDEDLQEFYKGFRNIISEVVQEQMDDVIYDVVLVWDKYFSHEEIKDLIEFYNSDTGKKVIRLIPVLNKEGLEAGKEWGDRLIKDNPQIKKYIEEFKITH